MKAVESAPRANATEALAALRWLLRKRGENEGLRNIVANKLRECGEEHLVSDLTVMLWDEKETPKWRNYCVQQLRSSYDRRPDPSILETLLKAAECDERMVRMCAIWSLARIMTPVGKHGELDEETVKRIRGFSLSALRDEETHFLVREAGIQSCARLGLTEALPDIRKLAGSDETKPRHLRIVAVAALGELKDAEGTAFLEKLAKESTGQLRAAAELALKRIRKAGATEELTDPAGNF